jgi:hypothetical protein
MYIFRQPPFPLSVTYNGLENSTQYIMQIYDDFGELVKSYNVTSSGSGVVTKQLDNEFEKFDGTFALYIYTKDGQGNADETVVIDTLYIYRPYNDPYSYSNDPVEIQKWIQYERDARLIIDSITNGFYYEQDADQLMGSGADILPITRRINKINYIYENNVLVFDRFDTTAIQNPYCITPDHNGITIDVSYEMRKAQWKNVQLPVGASDSFRLYGDNYDAINNMTEYNGSPFFPLKYVYVVHGEYGWPVIPQDIKEASRLLMDDIRCNKLDHFFKHVQEYQTDQFRIKYGDTFLSGTGNHLADKLLQGYQPKLATMRVL